MIVSAVRPAFQVENAFVDCQRGLSNHQAFNVFGVPLFISELSGLAMDSPIVRAARFTCLVANAFIDHQRGSWRTPRKC